MSTQHDLHDLSDADEAETGLERADVMAHDEREATHQEDANGRVLVISTRSGDSNAWFRADNARRLDQVL